MADTDSLSSDSETCPKLSKPIKQISQTSDFYGLASDIAAQPNPYSARTLSVKKVSSNVKGEFPFFRTLNIDFHKIYSFLYLQHKLRTIQKTLISSQNKLAYRSRLEWPWPKLKISLICKWR